MKKLLLLYLLFFIGLSLISASKHEIEVSLGLRESPTEALMPMLSSTYSNDLIDFGLRYHSPRLFNAAVSINMNQDGLFKHTLHSQLTNIADLGGDLSMTYGVGNDFSFLKNDSLKLSYRLRLQAALTYSFYSDYFPYSLTPDFLLNFGYKNEFLEANAFATFSTFFERTWQATPIIGGDFTYSISEINHIGARATYSMTDWDYTQFGPKTLGYSFEIFYKRELGK